MADHCCKSETNCCEPPAFVLPGQRAQAAFVATRGTAEDSCCPKGVPAFDGVNPRYKLILWTVIAINGAMFVVEMVAGQLAGSQALKADALDFLADTVTYGLSLAVIGVRPPHPRHGGAGQGRVAVPDGAVGVRLNRLSDAHPRHAES